MGDIGTQIAQVPFSRGVNTRADKRSVEAPDLTWAQNVVLDTEGVLRKRHGYASISNDDPRSSISFDRCDGLADYAGGLVAFAGEGGTWARAEGLSDLCRMEPGNGFAPNALLVSRTGLARNADGAFGVPRADIAYEPNSGILAAIYYSSAGFVQGIAIDASTGITRFTGGVGVNVQRFHALTVGQYIFVVLPSSNSANININRMDCTLPQNLAFNPNGGPQATDYDFASGGVGVAAFSSTQFFMAYSRGASIFVSKRSLTGVSVGSVVINETPIGPIAARYVGTRLWVAWQRSGGDIRVAAYDSALAPVVAPTTVKAASAQTFTLQIGARTSTSVLLAWDNGTDCRVRAIDTTGALLDSERTFAAHHIESAFFEVDGRSFLVLAKPSALQGGSYLVEVTVGTTVFSSCTSRATLAPLVSGALSTSVPGETVSSVIQAADGTFFFAMPVKTKITLSGGGLYSYASANIGMDLFGVDLTSGKRFGTARHGDLLFICGGTPCAFDGREVQEVGLLRFPEAPTLTLQVAVGGFIAPGVYQYCATYRHDDNKGRVWRSAPSEPFTVTVPAGPSTNVVTLNVGHDNVIRADARIELWRTEANESGPFFLVQNGQNNGSSTTGLSMSDLLADASINTNETLYTSGGALSNFPAPPCTFAVSHRDVLIVDNAEDGSLWQSKPLVVGEGFGFSEALTYRLSSTEKPVAGASMDDKCIIFTEHEIHMLVGDPLDDKGSGGGFTPQRLSSSVGCADPRTVCLGKDGIYFLSERGIELLTRGLEVVWVGADVDYWTSNYGECIFAEASPAASEIRFGFISPAAGIAEDHQILRLNYERKSQSAPFGMWTTEKLGMGVPRAGASAGGLMYFGYSDGRLFKESASLFTDNGVFVPSAVRMMLKPAGLQGFVRLRRLSVLAERKSSHRLTIYLRYNYDDAIVSQRAWANAEIAALPREQLMMLVDIQKAQAFEVEIQDSADTSGPGPDTGEGCVLSGLAMELAVRQRTYARALSQEAKK